MPQFSSRSDDVRQQIASVAARLIAEEGIHDYGLAKRKAARQLGLSASEGLPSNVDVEAALREWYALFQDDEHEMRVLVMRRVALDVMRLLRDFNPYLTGLLVDGLVGQFSVINIELFPESAKAVEIFLLGEGVSYVHQVVRGQGLGLPEAILEIDWDEMPVRLLIFASQAARFGRRTVQNESVARLNLQALEKIVLASQTKGGADEQV